MDETSKIKKRTKTPPKALAPTYPKVIETFSTWHPIHEQAAPSCVNGGVEIERYRVTVERIPEPESVLRDRLQRLWEESSNHHDYGPLQAVATRRGWKLEGPRGAKRKEATNAGK